MKKRSLVLLAIVAGIVIGSLAPTIAQTPPPPPAGVRLELTVDQLNVVLLGLQELKFKDVLPTYMAIINQTAPPAPVVPPPEGLMPLHPMGKDRMFPKPGTQEHGE